MNPREYITGLIEVVTCCWDLAETIFLDRVALTENIKRFMEYL